MRSRFHSVFTQTVSNQKKWFYLTLSGLMERVEKSVKISLVCANQFKLHSTCWIHFEVSTDPGKMRFDFVWGLSWRKWTCNANWKFNYHRIVKLNDNLNKNSLLFKIYRFLGSLFTSTNCANRETVFAFAYKRTKKKVPQFLRLLEAII